MSTLFKYIVGLRLHEVLFKLGFLLIGAFFSYKNWGIYSLIDFSILIIQAAIGAISIYAGNSFFGFENDHNNQRLVKSITLSKIHYMIIHGVFSFIALSCAYYHSLTLFLLASGVILLWLSYVHPLVNLKGRFGGGIAVAFLGEIGLFLLGYGYFSPISFEAFLYAIFFAGLFSSGHLFHEIIDYEADKKENILTTVVTLGLKKSMVLYHIMMLICVFYLVILHVFTSIPHTKTAVISYGIAFLLQSVFFVVKKNLFQYRRIYMLLHLIATLIVLVDVQLDLF